MRTCRARLLHALTPKADVHLVSPLQTFSFLALAIARALYACQPTPVCFLVDERALKLAARALAEVCSRGRSTQMLVLASPRSALL